SNQLQKATEEWRKFDITYDKSNHRKRILQFCNTPSNFQKPYLTFTSPIESLIITGHGRTKAHLFKMKLSKSTNCRFCNSEEENIDHLIFFCHAISVRRFPFPLLWNLLNPDQSHKHH